LALHPATERWLLIRQLDDWFFIITIAGIIVWFISDVVRDKYCQKKTYRKEWKIWGWWLVAWIILDISKYLFIIGFFVYVYWRFFLAWKGIYH
jgi:hypothetical protein